MGYISVDLSWVLCCPCISHDMLGYVNDDGDYD